MTLTDESIEISEVVAEPHALFEEARRRRRKRWMTVGFAAVLICLGVLAWWLSTGAGGGQPPATPIPPAKVSWPAPSVPSGATQLGTRSIKGFTFRIYAWPTGSSLVPVRLEYMLIYPHHSAASAGRDTVGPPVQSQPGIVGLGGDWGPSTKGLEAVHSYQVTLPSIATVRVVDGTKVLDSMSPATFDGVRFAALAALNVPSLRPLVVQALDGSGAVVASFPFQAATPNTGNASTGLTN